MFKNIVLALSLLVNGFVIYSLFPSPSSSRERMTCEQARNDRENKIAASRFSEMNGASLSRTHDFLKNSDYVLRNISFTNGTIGFIYVATSYPFTCGSHLPGIDGGIVRVETNLKADPQVISVY